MLAKKCNSLIPMVMEGVHRIRNLILIWKVYMERKRWKKAYIGITERITCNIKARFGITLPGNQVGR